MEDFMPTKTKASQNKKTTHSGVKQNAKTTQKKHTHKNTKVQKSTGRPQNKIKKETNTQSVSKVSTDMVKAVSVNSVMEQQKPVIKTAETVVPVFAPETTEKKRCSFYDYCCFVGFVSCFISYLYSFDVYTKRTAETTQSIKRAK